MRGVNAQIHVLTSALVRSEWSALRPCRFTSGERGTGTYLAGGYVGPTIGLNDTEELQFSKQPRLELQPPLGGPSSSQLLLRLY
jgi:hypothetical protein